MISRQHLVMCRKIGRPLSSSSSAQTQIGSVTASASRIFCCFEHSPQVARGLRAIWGKQRSRFAYHMLSKGEFMSLPFRGKSALVTGSSRGIGRAIAERLAADGAAVVINYARNKQPAQATVNKILERGGKAVAIGADISKPAEVAANVQRSRERDGASRHCCRQCRSPY